MQFQVFIFQFGQQYLGLVLLLSQQHVAGDFLYIYQVSVCQAFIAQNGMARIASH